SLKLRTSDRCVVTIPNSKVAQQSIQNFSLRDKFFVQKSFSLRHDMTAEQVTQVQTRIERLLLDTKEVERESSRVRLIDLSASGLKMEIWAYLLISPVADFARCVEAQERLFISVLRILEETGTALATPWQAPVSSS
ncbi:MAG TPA: mechanosensitive ion channel domain-containing protein, partial [Silvibacterium sp.]|nr:mechanosensitive ion channel domain-containing protein [Silvibacterium sp.]